MRELLPGADPPAPEDVWPELWPVLRAFERLGRDGSGGLLYAERELWLDRNGIEDPGERDAFHELWDEASAAEQRGRAAVIAAR